MFGSTQKYSQYIDAESAVVKKPEGQGWEDPFGDGVWRSSWFYSSLLSIKAKDQLTYDKIKNDHSLDDTLVARFLGFFRDNCAGNDAWTLPKNPSQKFSGDQLAPFLYLLGSVQSYGSDDAKSIAKDIVNRLIDLDQRHAAVSDTHQGQIRDNQRYAIDVVCRMYDINFLRGFRRDLCKIAFSVALALNNQLAQLSWEELATQDSYAVFNALSLVSLACIKWGSDDEDVNSWRSNYRVHADKGWGPAFRITSGRSFDPGDVDAYATAYLSRDQDNDIIMAQRPAKYISGEFKPDHNSGPGQWLVLDYIVLKGLQLVWQ